MLRRKKKEDEITSYNIHENEAQENVTLSEWKLNTYYTIIRDNTKTRWFNRMFVQDLAHSCQNLFYDFSLDRK